MADMKFKKRMTKTAFEARVVDELGNDGLTVSPYVEDGQRLRLYYKNGAHVGTWSCGVGWVFSSAY